MTQFQYSDEDDIDIDDGEDRPGPEIYKKRDSRPTVEQAPKSNNNRNLRIRPMSPAMRDKHPDVVSITLTRTNGRQLIFVRK